jgi:hypothetical protein
LFPTPLTWSSGMTLRGSRRSGLSTEASWCMLLCIHTGSSSCHCQREAAFYSTLVAEMIHLVVVIFVNLMKSYLCFKPPSLHRICSPMIFIPLQLSLYDDCHVTKNPLVIQEPPWAASLLGSACPWTAHQDYRKAWKDCRCVEEEINPMPWRTLLS